MKIKTLYLRKSISLCPYLGLTEALFQSQLPPLKTVDTGFQTLGTNSHQFYLEKELCVDTEGSFLMANK